MQLDKSQASTRQGAIEKNISKLHQPNQQSQEDAIEEISILLQQLTPQENQMMESTVLQIADVFDKASNQLRALIAALIFCKCRDKIDQMLSLSSKEVFLQRIENTLISNDPQARIMTLKILQNLPSFITTRLNVQHMILHILTTTTDKKERMVATQTIQKISASSDIFAKSIMSQIEIRIISDHNYFNEDTCQDLIAAMANVPSDASTVIMFFRTITCLYEVRVELRPSLLRSLLRMTLKAPILFDLVFEFVKDNSEAVEVLSKKYKIEPNTIHSFVDIESLMIRANQFFVLGEMIPAHESFSFDDLTHFQELEVRFHKSALKNFASNWILFAINELNGRVKFSNELLQTVYIHLVENKKLARIWKNTQSGNSLNLLKWFESQLSQHIVEPRVAFYLMQADGKLRMDLKSDKIARNNFIDFSLKTNKITAAVLYEMIKGLPGDDLFDIATTHFRQQSHLPILSQALRQILSINNIDNIYNCYYNKSRQYKFVVLCLIIVEVMRPLPQAQSAETINEVLLQRYSIAQDCLHRSIQLLQVKPIEQLEVGDPVQQDNTVESYKAHLLFQICKLACDSIYKRLDASWEWSLPQVERDQGICIRSEDSEFGFTIPRELFYLRQPPHIQIDSSLQNGQRVKREHMLLLKLKLIPKGCRDLAKRKKLGIWLSTVVLIYHGQNFVLEETVIVQTDSKVVSLLDNQITEVISMLPTPVSGNYLVKVHAQLIADGEELGLKSKRFINLRVD